MIVKVLKMDHQGRGIAKVNDKAVFIYNALPDEVVDIRVIKENKKIMEAVVLKYIETSKKRINPICPYYLECGGCDLMHINYNDELEYKENKIRQIIEKFTTLPLQAIKPIVGNDNKNYRNKATFHVDGKIGYYSKKSFKIVDIDNCFIASKEINDILKNLKKINLNNIYEIVIRTSKYLKDKMIILKFNNYINEEEIISKLKNIVDSIIIYQNKEYKTIYGKGFINDKIGDYIFKISPDSFFQVNTSQAKVLYDKVLEYLNPTINDKVLDLYCGTGTIGIYVSKYVKSVKGIEINKYAVIDANYNKKINNVDNISFECLDASKVDKIKDKFDSVIVDPPRSGLDKKTINYLINLKVEKIVYVSCDPVTLARDLEILKDYYDIKEITPVDMFSNTYHVECVCVLKLK
ncbi:MAG: 23S rRNA (uracil(1939)-C(5))-methyltransferase RlmD [Bacilli bacterium]|nr:23S rRNA (uracil(1939)-C(5))-methyltransferase RlmD [Bacilli bacterium]